MRNQWKRVNSTRRPLQNWRVLYLATRNASCGQREFPCLRRRLARESPEIPRTGCGSQPGAKKRPQTYIVGCISSRSRLGIPMAASANPCGGNGQRACCLFEADTCDISGVTLAYSTPCTDPTGCKCPGGVVDDLGTCYLATPAARTGNEPVALAKALVASPVTPAWCNFPAHVVQVTPIAFVQAAPSLWESAFRRHHAATQVSGPVASVSGSSARNAGSVITDSRRYRVARATAPVAARCPLVNRTATVAA
jgi:hypothetical protein